jgi:hypothetical protein
MWVNAARVSELPDALLNEAARTLTHLIKRFVRHLYLLRGNRFPIGVKKCLIESCYVLLVG